jgi:hypothetical protein
MSTAPSPSERALGRFGLRPETTMSSSLVSMPIVGFDLCRIPAGPHVADLLLAALQLDPARWRPCRRSTRRGAPRAMAPGRSGDRAGVTAGDRTACHCRYRVRLEPARDLVRSLGENLIGPLDALVRFVRDDVRLRPAAAAQLLAVKAFRAAGFSPRGVAYGAWNLISGGGAERGGRRTARRGVADVLRRSWRSVFPGL